MRTAAKGAGRSAARAELAVVHRIIRGDAEAWDAFVRRYADTIYGACCRVYDDAAAETAFGAVLGRLAENDFAMLRRFDARASLATYVQLLLKNLLADRVLETLRQDPARGAMAFEWLFRADIEWAIRRCFPLTPRSGALNDGTTFDDLYQEIWCRLIEGDYRRLRRFEGRGSFAAYVRRILYHLCVELLRARVGRIRHQEASRTSEEADPAPHRRRPQIVPLGSPGEAQAGPAHELADPRPSAESAMIAAEEARSREALLAALAAAVIELPEATKELIRRRFLDEPPKKPRELAEEMGLPVEEVYRLIRQAKARLRGRLVAQGIVGPDQTSPAGRLINEGRQ